MADTPLAIKVDITGPLLLMTIYALKTASKLLSRVQKSTLDYNG